MYFFVFWSGLNLGVKPAGRNVGLAFQFGVREPPIAQPQTHALDRSTLWPIGSTAANRRSGSAAAVIY
jgi:hypothetical protein